MEEEAPVEEEEPEAKALTGSVGKFVEEEEERTVPRAMGRSQEALAGGFGAEEELEREEQEIRASHVMTKPRVEEVPFMEFHN